jgi:tetratricopeptide (TPR) repeat protein
MVHMRREHAERWWLMAGVLVCVLTTGALYWLFSFMSTQSLDNADKWASVIGVFIAVIALAGGAAVYLFRQARPATQGKPGDRHDATAGGQARPSTPPAAGVEPAPGMVSYPRRPVDRLWGREQALTALGAVIDNPVRGYVGAAVVGMAGVGKTELALQLVRARHRGHSLTWWVNGESPGTLELGLAALARHLHPDAHGLPLGQQAEWAQDWLRSHQGWLLVLDNVEALADVATVLAGLGRGPVVVTSRWNLDWAACGLSVIELGVLARPDSALFLREGTGSADADADADADAERLAGELGDLPLALHQAVAYLREQKLSFDQYRQLLADGASGLMGSPAWTDVYRANAGRTLRLSISTIAAVRPSAEVLLRIACCFGPEHIPRALLAERPETGDRRSDLALLRAYSLVSVNEDTVSMHRLVRQLLRDSVTAAPAEVVVAARLLRAAIPLDPFGDVAEWPHWWSLVPHAEALEPMVDALGDRTASADLSQAEYYLGTFMLAQGWTSHAVRLLGRAATAHANLFGFEDPLTLDSKHRLGDALRELGDLPKALTLQETVLAGRLRLHGAADRRTLQSRETLAITYKALGRTDESILQHEEILRERIEALGASDSDVLWSMHNLALTYKQAGRLDEALTLHQAVLAERTQTLGADHPDTLRCSHNIANTHHAAGRYQEAMSTQEQNVADRIRLLGPTHRDTLRSQANLADTYLAVGRVHDAISLHRQTLRQREQTLGAENPDTKQSRERVAFVSEAQSGKTK